MTGIRHALRSIAALAALFVVIASAAAPARAEAQVHAGVDVSRLVPRGMELLLVRAPHRAEVPVRLALAPRGAQVAELLADVVVADDDAAARRALAGQLRALSGSLPAALDGLGDVGHADDGYAAFVRDNVVIVLRRVAGSHDVRSIAAAMDRVVAVSPAGSPRASATLRLPDARQMTAGESVRVALPSEVLDAFVEADGDVSIRRTRDGFIVTRTGTGTAALRAVVVDRTLRVTR